MEMKKERQIRLSKPYVTNKDEVMNSFENILNSGYFMQGKYVQEFENLVSSYLGTKYCIAVSSGTAALHLALIALGIGPGDEVILPAFTFPATGNVIELVGAKPIFVDVEPKTYNIDVEEIKKNVTDKTVAIMVVHLFGNPANMDEILNIAQKYDLRVIEDAAGALGSMYKGKLCGTIGDIGCFSFHPRKIVTTGEGGMVITKNSKISERIQILRNHGITHKGEVKDFEMTGFNYRMNEFEASLGIVQMKELSKIISERLTLVNIYEEKLTTLKNLEIQRSYDKCLNLHQAFVVKLFKMNNLEVIKELRKLGIETTVGAYALHNLSFYSKKYGYKPLDYPVASQLYYQSLALPFYNGMTSDEIDVVLECLKEVVENENRTS